MVTMMMKDTWDRKHKRVWHSRKTLWPMWPKASPEKARTGTRPEHHDYIDEADEQDDDEHHDAAHLRLPLLPQALTQVDVLEEHQCQHCRGEPAGYVWGCLVQHNVKAVFLGHGHGEHGHDGRIFDQFHIFGTFTKDHLADLSCFIFLFTCHTW